MQIRCAMDRTATDGLENSKKKITCCLGVHADLVVEHGRSKRGALCQCNLHSVVARCPVWVVRLGHVLVMKSVCCVDGAKHKRVLTELTDKGALCVSGSFPNAVHPVTKGSFVCHKHRMAAYNADRSIDAAAGGTEAVADPSFVLQDGEFDGPHSNDSLSLDVSAILLSPRKPPSTPSQQEPSAYIRDKAVLECAVRKWSSSGTAESLDAFLVRAAMTDPGNVELVEAMVKAGCAKDVVIRQLVSTYWRGRAEERDSLMMELEAEVSGAVAWQERVLQERSDVFEFDIIDRFYVFFREDCPTWVDVLTRVLHLARKKYANPGVENHKRTPEHALRQALLLFGGICKIRNKNANLLNILMTIALMLEKLTSSGNALLAEVITAPLTSTVSFVKKCLASRGHADSLERILRPQVEQVHDDTWLLHLPGYDRPVPFAFAFRPFLLSVDNINFFVHSRTLQSTKNQTVDGMTLMVVSLRLPRGYLDNFSVCAPGSFSSYRSFELGGSDLKKLLATLYYDLDLALMLERGDAASSTRQRGVRSSQTRRRGGSNVRQPRVMADPDGVVQVWRPLEFVRLNQAHISDNKALLMQLDKLVGPAGGPCQQGNLVVSLDGMGVRNAQIASSAQPALARGVAFVWGWFHYGWNVPLRLAFLWRPFIVIINDRLGVKVHESYSKTYTAHAVAVRNAAAVLNRCLFTEFLEEGGGNGLEEATTTEFGKWLYTAVMREDDVTVGCDVRRAAFFFNLFVTFERCTKVNDAQTLFSIQQFLIPYLGGLVRSTFYYRESMRFTAYVRTLPESDARFLLVNMCANVRAPFRRDGFVPVDLLHEHFNRFGRSWVHEGRAASNLTREGYLEERFRMAHLAMAAQEMWEAFLQPAVGTSRNRSGGTSATEHDAVAAYVKGKLPSGFSQAEQGGDGIKPVDFRSVIATHMDRCRQFVGQTTRLDGLGDLSPESLEEEQEAAATRAAIAGDEDLFGEDFSD